MKKGHTMSEETITAEFGGVEISTAQSLRTQILVAMAACYYGGEAWREGVSMPIENMKADADKVVAAVRDGILEEIRTAAAAQASPGDLVEVDDTGDPRTVPPSENEGGAEIPEDGEPTASDDGSGGEGDDTGPVTDPDTDVTEKPTS